MKSKCRNIKVLRDTNGYVIAKWCNRCYDYIDVESFDWDESREGYLYSWCKPCTDKAIQ